MGRTSKNWLNRALSPIDLDDVPFGGVLAEVVVQVTAESRRRGFAEHAMNTEDGHRRLSMHTGVVSPMNALNAMVREHGSLWWEAHVRVAWQPGQLRDTVGVFTHDGSGILTPVTRYPQ